MKCRPILTVLLCLLLAKPIQAAELQTVRGHVPAAVRNLLPVGELAASNQINLAIGLPLRNREALTNLLQRLYDPASADFHQFLTPHQFATQFGPSDEDYQSVIAYAKAHGLTVEGTHSNRTLVDVAGKVEDIEKTFHVKMRKYKHPREKREFYAPDAEPSLDLATPVLHISGLDNYIVPRPMVVRTSPKEASLTGARPDFGSGPFGAYMGNDFRAAYVPGVKLTGTGQSVGLFELDGFFPSDVATYVKAAGLPSIPIKTVLLDGFDGPPGGGNIEVSLDIAMAMSMAPGLESVLVYEGILPDDVLNRMATDRLARQLSASWLYGIDPSTEQIFQQYAAQGQSFFNSAGDFDAWVDGVDTPADDPNVTVVGGTTLSTRSAGGVWQSETVWNWDVEYGSNYDGMGTGGGISTTYPIPNWQLGINMTTNQGSATMRNLPDVAMIADNVVVYDDDGSTDTVGGTSIATPLWAGLTALVNEQALANGQP
ncbi:MAG TPA: S53 family peptidase, partial [Verrucomicrobiae bacterium]